jgi:hypothetical protein
MTARTVGCAALVGSAVAASIAVLVIAFAFIFGTDMRSAGDCETEAHPEACTTELHGGLIGSAALSVAVWSAAAGWGLVRGRSWARRSVMISHSLWAIALGGYFVAVAAAPEGLDASGVVVGLALTSAFLAIAVSAARLSPPGGEQRRVTRGDQPGPGEPSIGTRN